MAEPVNGDYERRISVIETKVDMFIDEMRDFKTEMRDRDNQRAAEIRALDEKILKLQESTDEKILKLQERTDAKFDKIESKIGKLEEKIDSLSTHVRNLAVTAMIGIGAMAVAVIGIAYSVMNKM